MHTSTTQTAPVDLANSKSRLMFITAPSSRYNILEEIRMMTEGGCDWVQLRVKEGLTVELARSVRQYIEQSCPPHTTCCLNDNLPIALAAGIHCLHLGKKDMPVAEAWQQVKAAGKAADFIIGATANTFEDIKRAYMAGASYIGLGPYRFTETKKNLSPILGLASYQRIMQQCAAAGIHLPVYAIGGIERSDIAPLMQTGITGIAVSGALLRAEDPVEETRRFIHEIERSLP